MLAVPIEENVARKNDESFYDENLEKILACLQLSEEIADNRKMMQVRITAFINPDLLVIFPIFLYKDDPGKCDTVAHSWVSNEDT